MKSRRNQRTNIVDQVAIAVVSLVLGVGTFLGLLYFTKDTPEKPIEETTEPPVVIEEPIEGIPSPAEPIAVVEPIKTVNDTNNYIYPFNTMSTDWGADIYESGFKYYQLPQAYVNTGGCFPEVVQVYLWSLCMEKNIDYYVAVALIERESGYRWNATSSDGTTKGYMQIYDKWHKDRMQAEGVEDVYNPYGNIRLGLSLLQELIGKYGENYHKVLMCYNMGETGCRNANNRGIYSTSYSRGILERAVELQQEIQG